MPELETPPPSENGLAEPAPADETSTSDTAAAQEPAQEDNHLDAID